MGPRASTSPFASVVFRAQSVRRVRESYSGSVFASWNRRKEEKERDRGTRRSEERFVPVFRSPASGAHFCVRFLFSRSYLFKEKSLSDFRGSIDRSITRGKKERTLIPPVGRETKDDL